MRDIMSALISLQADNMQTRTLLPCILGIFSYENDIKCMLSCLKILVSIFARTYFIFHGLITCYENFVTWIY